MKAVMLAAALASPAQPPRPCLTQPEAESITLVALPEVLRQAGVACAATLPATALLRQTASPLLQRYDAEADRAWPAARAAIVKLSDPQAEALLGSSMARPLLTSLVAPLIVGRIAAKDCPTVDRLVTQLAPLPPRNTAGVIVTTLQYLAAQKPGPGGKSPVAGLPLCPAEAS